MFPKSRIHPLFGPAFSNSLVESPSGSCRITNFICSARRHIIMKKPTPDTQCHSMNGARRALIFYLLIAALAVLINHIQHC